MDTGALAGEGKVHEEEVIAVFLPLPTTKGPYMPCSQRPRA